MTEFERALFFQKCRLSAFGLILNVGKKSSLIDSIFVAAPRGIYVHVGTSKNHKLEFLKLEF